MRKKTADAGLNECSVGPLLGARKREGAWKMESGGKGVNSSLCWEREKREPLVVVFTCPCVLAVIDQI